jgi:uncharacterized protein YdeI (YjbR/CyaY-like superfamily)
MPSERLTNTLQPLETFSPKSRDDWRAWLLENHDKKMSVWLIYFKAKSGKPSVSYSDAVDEALCFGWIDSKAKPIDADSYMQFFSRRKERSVWSRVNKEKVARLIAEGRMTQAGLAIIEIAKRNGSWTILDDAEALVIPDDLNAAFASCPGSRAFFDGLSRSDKRNILQWLILGKRAETRAKRISAIVENAAEGRKPRPF